MVEVDWGVIIASIAVIVVVIGIWFTNKQMRESNEMIKKDLMVRLRPWIRLEGCKPEYGILENGRIEHWETAVEKNLKLKLVKITASITNIGAVPCHVVSRLSKRPELFGREVVIDEQMKKSLHVIIMPNEIIHKSLEIPIDVWEKMAVEPFFVGIGVVYRINDETEAELGRIWEMRKGGNRMVDDWYEEFSR